MNPVKGEVCRFVVFDAALIVRNEVKLIVPDTGRLSITGRIRAIKGRLRDCRLKKAFQAAEEDGFPIANSGRPKGSRLDGRQLRSLRMADIICATTINGEDLSRDES